MRPRRSCIPSCFAARISCWQCMARSLECAAAEADGAAGIKVSPAAKHYMPPRRRDSCCEYARFLYAHCPRPQTGRGVPLVVRGQGGQACGKCEPVRIVRRSLYSVKLRDWVLLQRNNRR